jgi:flagellar basal body-associated protein FliL
MVMEEFREKISSKKGKLILLLVVFVIGILVGWYITVEFLEPETQAQLNERISELGRMNELLDEQVNDLSSCLSNEGINPNNC